MNILVVEDERNLADAIVRILEGASYHAEAVYDGTAGLRSALSGAYDAVVLDVMLPGMSGYEVVHEMRREGLPPRPSCSSPPAPPLPTRSRGSTPARTTT